MVSERSFQCFCGIGLRKLQNNLGMTKFNLINLVQIASDLSYFFLTIPYLIKKVLCGGVVILLCPI